MSIFNEVIQGSCVDVLQSLPDASVDLILTDPPYGVRYRDRAGRTIANDDNLTSVLSVFRDLYRVLRPDAFCISFYGWRAIDQFSRSWADAGFRVGGHLVFAKSYASSRRFVSVCHESAYLLTKGRPAQPSNPIDDVQSWAYSGNAEHPTEKAVQILTPLIRCFSKPDSIVLDPFAGSGSTLVAAALTGRRYVGIEIEARYCNLARRRLAGVARSFRRRNVA
jgi:site-specific DNA-methyltransferase (adenine-specific)